MIQIILLFALGFLCAGFLALLVAPLFWRRALTLTRKRLEGQAPMSMDEIRADRDSVRAESAVAQRKLELKAEAAARKSIAQGIEIDRQRNELADLRAEEAARTEKLAALETTVERLEADGARQAEELELLSERHAAAQEQLAARTAEFEELGDRHEEMTFTASSRQIEIVARETEIDNLEQDMADLRGELAKANARIEELASENSALEAALAAERTAAANLERPVASSDDAPDDDARDARLRKLSARKDRLETRLAALVRENRRLRADAGTPGDAPSDQEDADPALRDQLAELAAEIVHLTARLEGPDSPLAEILDAEPQGPGGSGEGASGTGGLSLADRIRALRAAAAG